MHNSLTDFPLPDTSVIYGEKASLNHNKDENLEGGLSSVSSNCSRLMERYGKQRTLFVLSKQFFIV